jgi:hypothetical protein
MAKSSPDPQPGGDGNGPMFLVRGGAKKPASRKKAASAKKQMPAQMAGKVKAPAKARTRRAEKGGDGNGPLI